MGFLTANAKFAEHHIRQQKGEHITFDKKSISRTLLKIGGIKVSETRNLKLNASASNPATENISDFLSASMTASSGDHTKEATKAGSNQKFKTLSKRNDVETIQNISQKPKRLYSSNYA